MKKMVLQLTIEDEKRKRKALKIVAAVAGVDSVAVDMKEEKMTVIGEADPVFVTVRLRKFGFNFAELQSVGPAKDDKKEEKKRRKMQRIQQLFMYRDLIILRRILTPAPSAEITPRVSI